MPCQKLFTPPQLAKLWCCEPAKVIAFIESGELKASNMATNPSGRRKRWKIRESAIEAFLAGREAKPPEPRTRRQKPDDIIAFY